MRVAVGILDVIPKLIVRRLLDPALELPQAPACGRREALEAAGIERAAAVAITLADAAIALECCAIARDRAPQATIAVRTRHLSEALQARQLRTDITNVEEMETASAMEDVLTAALMRPGRERDSDRRGVTRRLA